MERAARDAAMVGACARGFQGAADRRTSQTRGRARARRSGRRDGPGAGFVVRNPDRRRDVSLHRQGARAMTQPLAALDAGEITLWLTHVTQTVDRSLREPTRSTAAALLRDGLDASDK